MSAKPTGTRTDDGALRLLRVFPIEQHQLWNYLTQSQGTAGWIGPWSGEPERGSVQLTMTAEQEGPAMDIRVLECDPSLHRLVVESGQEPELWHLELEVRPDPEGSLLEFRMPGIDPAQAGSIGPGWEYYLDRLLALAAGRDPEALAFDPDYYPALSSFYELLFRP